MALPRQRAFHSPPSGMFCHLTVSVMSGGETNQRRWLCRKNKHVVNDGDSKHLHSFYFFLWRKIKPTHKIKALRQKPEASVSGGRRHHPGAMSCIAPAAFNLIGWWLIINKSKSCNNYNRSGYHNPRQHNGPFTPLCLTSTRHQH